VKENPESISPPDRRLHRRYPTDDHDLATVLVLSNGSHLSAHILELSLGGCRLQLEPAARLGSPLRVEVSFHVHRIAFRLAGITQWTDGRQRVGVRFGEMSARRKEDLTELLAEMESDQAAKSAADAESESEAPAVPAVRSQSTAPVPGLAKPAGATVQELQPASQPEQPPPQKAVAARTSPLRSGPLGVVGSGPLAAKPETTDLRSPAAASGLPAAIASAPPSAGQGTVPGPSQRYHREQVRHSVDTGAMIFFIDVAARAHGRILDVSLNGCCIRTEDKFPVGIYRRVETEFRIDGLPFRLGGVVQSLHDRHTVGIRFLDLSERKREHLRELMEEIEEMRQSGTMEALDAVDGGQGSPSAATT
jgi:c-di-GMP-binding flagellar brake protein YcgR